jgi:diguanylate cyclase (GGDEF)-like protein/PAS domain S-box-containing protein
MTSFLRRINPFSLLARRMSPLGRLAVGLVSLTVCLLLMLDFTLGLFPDRVAQAKPLRQAVAQGLGAQVALVLPSESKALVGDVITQAQLRTPELRSVAIRTLASQSAGAGSMPPWLEMGDHAKYWEAPSNDRSTINSIRVPIMAGAQQWGVIELGFEPVVPRTFFGWLKEPVILGILSMGSLGGLAFYLYLRRALQFLDPTNAVPERVRAAFDTLSEGLMVIDTKGLVVLVNEAMRNLLPANQKQLNGRGAASIPWLTQSLGADPALYPWSRAMRENRVITFEAFVAGADSKGQKRHLVLKANPIVDSREQTRGCILTFDDVTQLQQVNEKLKATLKALETSKAEVQNKAVELQRLASRDPLTGCLNRRSFFEALELMRKAAGDKQQNLTFVMCDVDHFKSFNDRFGHAVGDQVLQIMAKLLQEGCRESDLLVRMGGEEFCIAFRGMSLVQARERAERIRQSIETRACVMLGNPQAQRITASFGVATLPVATVEPKQLLELADQALYASKRGGRNRVTTWPFAPQQEEELDALPI